jgi:hypothetical protein
MVLTGSKYSIAKIICQVIYRSILGANDYAIWRFQGCEKGINRRVFELEIGTCVNIQRKGNFGRMYARIRPVLRYKIAFSINDNTLNQYKQEESRGDQRSPLPG